MNVGDPYCSHRDGVSAIPSVIARVLGWRQGSQMGRITDEAG